MELTNEMLKNKPSEVKKIFLTYGLNDFLDPDGVIKDQLFNFTQLIDSNENIVCKLKIYEDEGHVPFQSLYHGLIIITE